MSIRREPRSRRLLPGWFRATLGRVTCRPFQTTLGGEPIRVILTTFDGNYEWGLTTAPAPDTAPPRPMWRMDPSQIILISDQGLAKVEVWLPGSLRRFLLELQFQIDQRPLTIYDLEGEWW